MLFFVIFYFLDFYDTVIVFGFLSTQKCEKIFAQNRVSQG